MRSLIFPLLALVFACAPAAQEPAVRAGDLEISGASAAPSPNGVDVAAGYLTITNHGGEADRLMSAASPRAATVEVHTMAMDGAVMRMRKLDALNVPANGAAALQQGGDHLMFMGLTQPFAAGEEVPVRLHFERAGDVDVTLPVRGPAAHGH